MEKPSIINLTDGFLIFRKDIKMDKLKFRNLTIAVSISLAFLLLYNISSFSYSCQTIRNDVIRLHILANSDSKEDQELKLKVRDAVLEQCPAIFDGTVSPQNAKEKIEPEINNIKKTAESIISEYGYSYNTEVYLEEEYFTTRIYDDVTMPAGKYLALKIIIGNGNGKNWWCVMFPTLCLPAAEDNSIDSVFNNTQQDIVINTEKYEVRFKIMEYIEAIKNRITNQ